MDIATRITELRRTLGQAYDMKAAVELLHWDQEVNLAPKGFPTRALQLATLSAMAHRHFTSEALGRQLEELQAQHEHLAPDDAKLVSEAAYDYGRNRKLPEQFVQDFAEAQSNAFHAWKTAREKADFSLFAKHLEKLLDFVRRKAEYFGYEATPYDALLEEYERGLKTRALKDVFGELAPKQRALVARIQNTTQLHDHSWTEQEWNTDAQWKFTLKVLRDIGYDFEAGRQDLAVHPFTITIGPHDVRVTTRLHPQELFSALTGSIHEGGHALYDQGFLEEDARTPLAEGISLGIHESQSRLWENMVGRSLPFWQHYIEAFKDAHPGQLNNISAEQVFRAINQVEPSFIRVEADECTYNLHIILRFELELALVEGDLKPAELPEAWNAKMQQYLGLTPPNDALGCLQDVHWSHGSFGYFPTYALGNLYAAQFMEQIEQDLPELWTQVGQGDFAPLLGWLRQHIHRVGRRKTAPELIESITGRPPESAPFLRYLERKYAALYAIGPTT